MRFPRYRVLLLLCVCLISADVSATTPPSSQDPTGHLVAAYAVKFDGEVVTLRIPSTSNSLHFGADGKLKSKSHTGPWTLYSRLLVENVKANGQQLEVEGTRVWVKFNGNQMVNLVPKPAKPVTIDIDLARGPNEAKQAHAVMAKVFLSLHGRMSDVVPPAWKPYFERQERENAEAHEDMGDNPDAPSGEAIARNQGQQLRRIDYLDSCLRDVSPGRLVHTVRPIYPPEAANARVAGTVILHAVVGKDGKIESITVDHPAGVGLDDAAMKAVKRWRYKPYRCGKAAIEVPTSITINFTVPH